MISVWRIATDTPKYTSDDLTGAGAWIEGGRWNEKGTPVLYASLSIALACLETLVHLASSGLPLNRYLVRIDIEDAVWSVRQRLAIPPVGWDAIPAGRVSIDEGQKWISRAESLILEVPSVIVPEEFDVLINPKHPDAATLKATKIRKWMYDGRFSP